MDNPLMLNTPREVVAAICFLRDEVLKGKLTMAPLLRKKLTEAGLLRERAFHKLLADGRRAFLSRTRESDRVYEKDVAALSEFEVMNDDFRRKVQAYVDRVMAARTEEEIYVRIDILKAFLEEFGFYSTEFMRNALGNALFDKYVSRESIPELNETEQEAQ